MALADAAEHVDENTPIRAPRCNVGHVLAALDTADRELLEGWLFPPIGEPRKTNPWISSVLAADGHTGPNGRPVSVHSITRHRQRVCAC